MKGPDKKKIDQVTEDTEQLIKTIDEKDLETASGGYKYNELPEEPPWQWDELELP